MPQIGTEIQKPPERIPPGKNPIFQHLAIEGYGDYAAADRSAVSLTTRYLEPHLASIRSLFRSLRREIDRCIVAEFTEEQRNREPLASEQTAAEYPLGWCSEIRNGVYELLMRRIENQTACAGSRAIKTFLDKGGIIRGIYGIASSPGGSRWFQNALQMGSLIVDCAADTVAGNSAMLAIYPIGDRRFRNIETFADYFDVRREYHGHPIYPTSRYFPMLAPYFPAIAIHPYGELKLDILPGIFARNILGQFKQAEEFQRTYTFTAPELPPGYRDYLKQVYSREGGIMRFDERPSDPAAHCAFWRKFWAPLVRGERPMDELRSIVGKVKLLHKKASRLEAASFLLHGKPGY